MGAKVVVEGDVGAPFQGCDKIAESGGWPHGDVQGYGDFDKVIVATLQLDHACIMRLGYAT